jgi:ketosteroid isomerase-like protein
MSSYRRVITERQMQQVRDLYAAFGRMPIASFVEQFAASDVELKPVPDWAVLSSGEEVWRGRAAVTRSLEELETVVGRLSAELLELVDLGDSALAAIQLRGAGRESGADVELPVWHVIELGSDDLIKRMRSFPSEADAYAAVGSPAPRSAETSSGPQPPAEPPRISRRAPH